MAYIGRYVREHPYQEDVAARLLYINYNYKFEKVNVKIFKDA